MPFIRCNEKSQGRATVAKVGLCYDPATGRIAPQGKSISVFGPTDKILFVFKEGYYLVSTFPFQIATDTISLVEPLRDTHLLSIVYYNAVQQNYFVKRFVVDEQVVDQRYNLFFSESDNCILQLVTSSATPTLQLHYLAGPTGNDKRSIIYDLEQVAVKTIKAKGTLLSKYKITAVDLWNK